MPYITEKRRDEIHDKIRQYGTIWSPENAGDMNYLTSELIANFLRNEGLSYANLNEMIGMLECCKMELYRLIGAPYEDIKAKENGPVYTCILPAKEY